MRRGDHAGRVAGQGFVVADEPAVLRPAARTHDIINALTGATVPTLADRRYKGAGGSVRTPFNGTAAQRHRRRQRLSRREKAVTRPRPHPR